MANKCLSVGILVADHLCAPISHPPEAGELVMTERLELAIGGCASNVALDLARLGVEVDVVGCVGRDLFGRFLLDNLAAAGVGVGRIRQVDDVGTSGTLIINVAGQDRRFVHTAGANVRLRAEEIRDDDLRGAGVLYVGGYLLLAGFDPEPTADLFRRAQALGIRTVLDVVVPGPGDYWPRLAAVLPSTDVFLPNDDECRGMTGLADPLAQAERCREAGAKTVVITCGQAGAVLVGEGLRVRAGVYPTRFVGATGSGDAFDAGFIAGLLAGLPPLDCLRWGAALGASCVRAIGATEAVFRRDEAEAFLAAHDLPIERL